MCDMTDEVRAAVELLPAWFIPRMMTDNWTFGLLTDTGITFAISSIDRVHKAADGQLWIDVELIKIDIGREPFFAKTYEHPGHPKQLNVVTAPTGRTQASIAVSHIVAAFELADT